MDGNFTFPQVGTNPDSIANGPAPAGHLLTSLPAPDDWQGWIDVWCRDDTGNIESVPDCLRHHVEHLVGADGYLKVRNMVPDTPYKIARWSQLGGSERPPWVGTGLSPHEVKRAWAAEHIDESDNIEPSPPEPDVEYADLYFIVSAGGPIKIGVSGNPVKRLKGLQTSHPHRLSIAAIVRGGARQECEYHHRFADHRMEGEWFHPHPDILAEIERLSAGAPQ